MTEDSDLYLLSEIGRQIRFISVSIDDELKVMNSQTFAQQAYHIGNVKKGQKVTVCAVPTEPQNVVVGEEVDWYLQFASFDEEAYAKAYEVLSKNVYEIKTYEDDYISGTIQTDETGIMMTSIQAQDGFEVYVDGKREDYVTIADTMIGVPLEKGGHTVEFKYHTPSLLIGKLVSAGAVILFVILCIVDYRKRQTENTPIQKEE